MITSGTSGLVRISGHMTSDVMSHAVSLCEFIHCTLVVILSRNMMCDSYYSSLVWSIRFNMVSRVGLN